MNLLNKPESKYWVMVGLLMIVAAGLRFYHLDFNNFWIDEIWTVYFANLDPLTQLPQLLNDPSPPLFYLVEHLVAITLGDGYFALRLLPCIFGILSVPLMYLVGREAVDRNVGLIAAGLLTFSLFHIHYSQEARMYSLMLLFLLAALYFYFKALKSNRDNYAPWIYFTIFAALTLWTHYYVGLIFILCFLNAVLVKAKDIKNDWKEIIPIVGAGVALFGLTWPLIRLALIFFGAKTATIPIWGLSGFDVIVYTFYELGNNVWAVMLILLVLVSTGIYRLQQQGNLTGQFLGLCIFFPTLVAMALSDIMPTTTRYLFFIMPFFFIAISSNYRWLEGRFTPRQALHIVIGVGLLLCVISVPAYHLYYTEQTKYNWEGFMEGLAEITDDGDIVLLVPSGFELIFNYYYYDNVTDKTLLLASHNVTELDAIKAMKDNNTIYLFTFYNGTFVEEGETDPRVKAKVGYKLDKWVQENARYHKTIGQEVQMYKYQKFYLYTV